MVTTQLNYPAILAAASEKAISVEALVGEANKRHQQSATISLMFSGHLDNPVEKFRKNAPELLELAENYLAAKRALADKFAELRAANDTAMSKAAMDFLRTVDPNCYHSSRGGIRCTFYTTSGGRKTVTVKHIRSVHLNDGVLTRVSIDFSKDDDNCTDMSALEVREGRILFDDEEIY